MRLHRRWLVNQPGKLLSGPHSGEWPAAAIACMCKRSHKSRSVGAVRSLASPGTRHSLWNTLQGTP